VLWENDRKPHPYTSDLVVPHYRPISPSPNWTTAAKEYKGPGSYAYVRLPDTVDPRGKAGGR
jgi:hypothetical protein